MAWYDDILNKAKGMVPENTNIFGASPNPNLKTMYDMGLLGQDSYQNIIDKANKQSMFQGLLNTGLSYVAQPKNQNYGSFVPYAAKALMSGSAAAQQPYDQVSKNALTFATLQDLKSKRQLAEKEANKIDSPFSKPNPLDLTDESRKAYQESKTPQNPQGDITLLRKIPTPAPDTRVKLTKLLADRDNLDKTSPNYAKNYQFYTENINKEINYAPPIVDMGTQETGRQKKYGEAQGTKFFETDQKFVESGPKALDQLNKTNRALILANKPGRKEGALAGLKLLGEKAFAAFGGTPTKAALDSISDTELLNSTLSSDVFPLIGKLEIGARGIDTPAERDFLQMAFTGNMTMSNEALTKLTAIRQKYELSTLQDFNEGIKDKRFSEEGEYGRKVKPMTYKFEPIAVMDPSTTDLLYKNENQFELDGGVIVNGYGPKENQIFIDTKGYVHKMDGEGEMSLLGPLNKLGVEF